MCKFYISAVVGIIIDFHLSFSAVANFLPYLLTYSMEQSPWKANRFSASQEIPLYYGTWRFITAITSVRHLSLSWARSIQSKHPHPISWRCLLILSSYLCPGLKSGLFHTGFPTKTLYTPRSPPYVLYTPLISSSIISPEQNLVSSTDH